MCFVALKKKKEKRKTHHFIHISFYFEIKNHAHQSPPPPGPSSHWGRHPAAVLGLAPPGASLQPVATPHACWLSGNLICHQAVAALPCPPTQLHTPSLQVGTEKAQLWRVAATDHAHL